MSGSDTDKDGTELAVLSKRDWPRTEYGTIDWEAAFEQGDHGLIPMVERSSTAAGILACSLVIIRSLFSRADDADSRIGFERPLNDAMSESPDGDDTASGDAERRRQVIELLREIKEHRVERANFHIARIKAGIDKKVERRDNDAKKLLEQAAADAEETPDIDVGGAEAAESTPRPDQPDAADEPEFSAETAFVEALSRLLGGRLSVLREGIKPGPIAGALPPYPVSPEFAERFDELIRDQFAPAMMAACRPFILQAEHRDPKERVAYILENMEERRSREILWESWQVVWNELTDQQEPPKKPKEEKKSLLGRLKKKEEQPAWMGETLTVEEWKDEVKRIERANERARNIWARLTEPHKRFLPPDDSDRKTLMNLFARTSGALSKQISAVRQIAEQGGNPGKVFSDYQQGKDIDLPLLCACCQRQDLFLKKGVLKDFMRGFLDAMKQERFRLTSRFFAKYV